MARAQKFTRRLQGYLAAWGKLNQVLDLLATINTMTSLLAHGTAMPKEQHEADQVLKNSQEAINGGGRSHRGYQPTRMDHVHRRSPAPGRCRRVVRL